MSSLVTCPVCGQYEGKPESVRAHISAKRDEAHSGKTGFDYDDQLGLSDGSDTGDDTSDEAKQSTEVPAQEPVQEPVEVPTVESLERDRDDDGNEIVKLTLAGAGAYAVAKLLTGQSRNRGRGEM